MSGLSRNADQTSEPKGPAESRGSAPRTFGENYFRTIFESAADGMMIADAESNYLDANPSMCRMLGYTRDELIGLHARDILVAVEHVGIARTLNAIHEGADYQRAWRFRRKDGSQFDAEVLVNGLPDGNIVACIRDMGGRREAEARSRHLAAIVESSEDAITSTSLESIITSWNRGAERMTGYRSEEVLGRSLCMLLPEEYLAQDADVVAAILRGEHVSHFESCRLRKDGGRLVVSSSASPIRDAVGNIVGISRISRDITAQRENEHEIARLGRLYAALSQINQAIVWEKTRPALLQKVCDVLVEFGEFSMAWIGMANPASQRMLPLAISGDDQGYVQQLEIYVDDRPEGRGPTGTAYREGRTVVCADTLAESMTRPWREAMERSGFRASAAIPIHEGGTVCGTLNVYSNEPTFFGEREVALLEEAAGDLSFAIDNLNHELERKRAEMALREAEGRFHTLFDSAPVGVLVCDPHTGTFTEFNDQAAIQLGYTRDAFSGLGVSDIEAGESPDRIRAGFDVLVREGGGNYEARHKTRYGELRDVLVTARLIKLAGRKLLQYVFLDITERKRSESLLRELNETLEARVADRTRELQDALVRADASDRLKSAFLATMSHELRTPLNSIIGFTGILLQGLPGAINDEQRKQLGMVLGSARHLLALINDVLDISKIEAGQLEVRTEPFDLQASIRQVMESLRPIALRQCLEFGLNIDPRLGVMNSDRRRVEQILLNLLGNAIKFTERGSVTLSAVRIDRLPTGVDGMASPAVLLTVTDTGPGIRSEDLPSLFQPFRQLDSGLTRSHEGTGLGLAICARLTGMLGGTISVESTVREGSSFKVALPLVRPEAA